MSQATPADAKAAWESMKDPSARKVAEKLANAGKAVSFKTVNKWRNAGWTSKAPDPVKKAKEGLDQAAPLVTGNPASTAKDLVPANAEPTPIGDVVVTEGEANSTMVERSLRTLVVGAEAVARKLLENAHLLVMAQPEALAKSLVAVSAAINTAADGLARLPALREGEAHTIQGAVEILPPTHKQKIESDPLRSSLLAYEQVLGDDHDGGRNKADTGASGRAVPDAGPDGDAIPPGEGAAA